MQFLVALGNPGARFSHTRHNIGFRVADALRLHSVLPAPTRQAQYCGNISEGAIEGQLATVLYPDTYMNKSGEAVAALVPRDRIANLVVIHDDVALPLGRVRISFGSGAGGHNGVASIIAALGTNEFIRVRLGVGAPPPTTPLEQYVLQPFLPDETPRVTALIAEGVEAICMIVREGVAVAMNKVNGRTE